MSNKPTDFERKQELMRAIAEGLRKQKASKPPAQKGSVDTEALGQLFLSLLQQRKGG